MIRKLIRTDQFSKCVVRVIRERIICLAFQAIPAVVAIMAIAFMIITVKKGLTSIFTGGSEVKVSCVYLPVSTQKLGCVMEKTLTENVKGFCSLL